MQWNGSRTARFCVVLALLVGACGSGENNGEARPARSQPTVPSLLPETTSTSTSTSTIATTTTTTGVTTGSTTAPAPTVPTCDTPDRTRIMFRRTMPTGEPIWHLFSIKADGSCLRQITHGNSHVLNWGGSWSPDGRRIAFIRKDAGVMLAEWNGANERLLLAETAGQQPSSAHTDWSPDATSLVVERQQGIWVIDVATGEARNISQRGSRPSWSPDGKRIVFSDFGDGEDVPWQVITINPDGSDRKTIRTGAVHADWGSNNRIVMETGDALVTTGADGADVQTLRDSANHSFPRWNAAGTSVVTTTGPGDMRVYNLDGTNFAVNSGDGNDTAFDW